MRLRTIHLWNLLFSHIPLPVRLPYGGWWLAIDDVLSDAILTGTYEKAEQRFIEQFLKEGMIVLDIGAHHGFFTILFSRRVGHTGRVISFEPSLRERRRLLSHLKLNHCLNNVKVEPLALANQEGETKLFVVDGRDTGCNSLRRPTVSNPTEIIIVITQQTILDKYLEREGIHHVDFIKIDVEGAELEVFKGARLLLNNIPRPIILCEVDDYRTQPWGYPAKAIIEFLEAHQYQWFGLSNEGEIMPLAQHDSYNLLAIPKEFVDGTFALLCRHEKIYPFGFKK